jgi:hypothetical protein
MLLVHTRSTISVLQAKECINDQRGEASVIEFNTAALSNIYDPAFQMFFPHAIRRVQEIQQADKKFAHYTSAQVAMSIISQKKVWMRNSSVMNDFNEISHGVECVKFALETDAGKHLEKIIDSIHPDLFFDTIGLLHGKIKTIRSETYLTCISEHNDDEKNGRLSMWRAYAPKNGVALVLNNEVFLRPSEALKAYTSPVAYCDPKNYESYLIEILNAINRNISSFNKLSREEMRSNFFGALRFAMCCTKHPGFAEEQEWRVLYSPKIDASDLIKEDIEIIGGVPQIIQKIPLEDNAEHNLFGIDPNKLLEKIIIGPSEFPNEIRRALALTLERAGVQDPWDRVVVSDIPLRH